MSKARHHMKHGGHHHRAGGGRLDLKAAGNPDVFKEAEGEEDYAKGDEKKHGGKVKKHHRANGGKALGLMTGGGVKARGDRAPRARGGRTSSDRSPLTSAHGGSKSSPVYPKEQEGGMSSE